MSAVAILNASLAVLVVAAILSLLAWGIRTERAVAVSRTRRLRHVAPPAAARGPAHRREHRLGSGT